MVNIQCFGFTCNGEYFRKFLLKWFSINSNNTINNTNNLFINFVDFNNIINDIEPTINLNETCNIILFVYSSIHEWISYNLKTTKFK